ncbi:glycoside hydrolase family 2 TIM barrel-domain containing protein [Pseudopedobacter beijingensis]|uniref:Glycoside hydrolase family 2 TIM barrel-domain containing protein n=1 Tax=Pseudopedobacter beijingensis TaxID=1207056 RepID=A0ABW4IE21_9SPHI
MKFYQSLILFLLLSLTASAQRDIQSLNAGWKFFKGDKAGAHNLSYDDKQWEKVNVPHTWNAQDAYQTKEYYRGDAWYRKTFLAPKDMVGKQVFIRFEGVLLKAQVYLNGQLLGTHKGGYTAFNFDITPFLKSGEQNVLAVKVDNSPQNIAPLSGDFTLFGGIYRDVWLIATSKLHFDMDNFGSDGVFVQTPVVSEQSANISIKGSLKNNQSKAQAVKIAYILEDAEGKVVLHKEQRLSVNKNQSSPFQFDIKEVKKPKLWSPETPYLYTLRTQLIDAKNNQKLDEMSNPIGFRWFRFDAKTGFYLNGKPYKLLGVCRHQDQQWTGSALSDETHRRDMQMIKDMGANFIRIAHYPQDKAILEACDKLGLLAWEEIPVVDMVSPEAEFFESTESQLREMIRQNYNHPSIILWGYMNEVLLGTLRKVSEQDRPKVFKATQGLAQKLEDIVRKEDPYRLTVSAQHEAPEEYEKLGLSSVSNILGWNLYQGWYGGDVTQFGRFMDDQHARYPDRSHIISEYGAGSDRRIHSLNPECFDFSIEYQQEYNEKMMQQILERPNIAGSALWNFIDFGSAFREESMPHINNKGIVYADRTPKDVYYYYKALFNKKPVVHIASRDWTRRTGISENGKAVIQPIKVYSNLKAVELFIDGKSLGIKNTSNCTAIWDVPFSDGEHILTAQSAQKDTDLSDALRISFQAQPKYLQNIDNHFELGVNVGSTSFFTDDVSGFTWIPEQAYQPGSWGYIGGEILRNTPDRIGIQLEIAGTHNIPLYQTMRKGLQEFRFDVPKGTYEVELHFTEPGQKKESILNDIGFDASKTDERNIFSVSLNNRMILEDFNMLKTYGPIIAVHKKYITETAQHISIKFKPIEGNTLLSAIKLRKIN